MPNRMQTLLTGLSACVAVLVASSGAWAQSGADIPRTASGRPDLSGSYDTATVTPRHRRFRSGRVGQHVQSRSGGVG